MKLTIGMIVKNEEKWLDKCLSAIRPILDNVDSELIVTDTGSTDRTVEIAKKYTDKVLHFDWINDFSAARNFGLEKACGEWFMMLDADDIFRSCDHIISFFNSGEYKKYNSATYISRNLHKTAKGDGYSDTLAPRMVKLTPDTKYEYAVHESLTTFDPPYKNLEDIADHYGYYYETDEQRERKFRRNAELLQKKLDAENGTNPMTYLQLYEAYRGIEQNDKALEYMDKGIELCRQKNSIVLAALYFHKSCYYQAEKMYPEAVEVCHEYFRMNKAIRPYPLTTDGEIYGIEAICLYEIGEYRAAAERFSQFFDIYKDIGSGKLVTYDRYLRTDYMCCEINILPLFVKFIESCVKAGSFGMADSRLSSFPAAEFSFESRIVFELVQQIMEVAEHFDYKTADSYFRKLDTFGKKVMADELFDRLVKTGYSGSIVKALEKLSASDERIAMKTDVYLAGHSGEDISGRVIGYVKKYGASDDFDLMYLMIKSGSDISVLLSDQVLDLKKCAFVCCRNFDDMYDAAENYSADIISDPGTLTAAVKLYEYIIAVRLLDNEDKTPEEKESIIRKLFTVKTALKKRSESSGGNSEFEKLASSVKKNIRALIAAGDIQSASKMLTEYRKLSPGDPEADMLLSLINTQGM